MHRSIFRYILTYSKRDQINILVVTAAGLPFIYLVLELPKMIINDAIGGREFPVVMLGFSFEQIPYLMALSFVLLLLILLNGLVKYFVNVYRGVVGERLLRRLRYDLYRRVLRFPLPRFKTVSQGELIPMITAEIEPLGLFIGDAFSLPAFQGSLLLTYLFFIFNQDLYLGLAAVALYPPQMYLIPKLQRKVNLLAKRRVLTVRKLADRIGEAVSGITEIHAHDTSHFERADFADRLGSIYDIRYEIFRRKFFIKFLNNFLAQITPFLFYAIGGYFVIRGGLTLGALVAVLAAYKSLSAPWKDLLKYYQQMEDNRIKYEQVIDQFDPEGMLDESLQDDEPETIQPLEGKVAASNLSLTQEEIVKIIENASFTMALEAHTAIVGPSGSGREEVARLLARLVAPTGGRIDLGGRDLAAIPEAVTGRRMAYVGRDSYLFGGSVRDNLYYGLKHRPLRDAEYDGDEAGRREQATKDAEASGNTTLDIQADWIDYAAAGAADRRELDEKALQVLDLVELGDDVYRLGLRSRIDPAEHGALAERLLEARAAFHERLAGSAVAAMVEPLEADRYNTNATVAENLLFGTPDDPAFDEDRLARHPYVIEVLEKTGLLPDLLEVGRQVAETMVEIFSDLPPGHEFFEQYSFIDSDDLPDFQALLGRTAKGGIGELDTEDKGRLLALVFQLTPARHRLDLIDEDLQKRVVDARRVFADGLPEQLAGIFQFFSADKYNSNATLQDNVLFGRLSFGQSQAQGRVGDLMGEVLESLGLKDDVLRVGLDYQVGNAGGRLSLAQRQKVAIARCLMKEPDVLLVNEATGPLDAAVEGRIMESVLARRKGRGVIWVLSRPALARHFDGILVMDEGKVAEQGTFAELESSGPVFRQLLQTA